MWKTLQHSGRVGPYSVQWDDKWMEKMKWTQCRWKVFEEMDWERKKRQRHGKIR